VSKEREDHDLSDPLEINKKEEDHDVSDPLKVGKIFRRMGGPLY